MKSKYVNMLMTWLILEGLEKYLSEALWVLESFNKVSGLRLNSKKTKALWIGSYASMDEAICLEHNWLNAKV